MKTKSLLGLWLAVLLAAVTDAGAQGTLVFNNFATQRITNYYTQSPATGLTIGLYVSTNAGDVNYPNSPNFVLLRTTNIYPVAGRFTGGTVVVPGAAGGSSVAVFIAAWSGSAPDYASANADWECDRPPGTLTGRSQPFVISSLGIPTGPNATPPASLSGLKGFSVFGNTGIPTAACWPATLSVVPGSYPFRLCINADTQLLTMGRVTGFVIQKCIILTTNQPYVYNTNWVPVTSVRPSTFPYYWTDPEGTNARGFYRLEIGQN